MTSVVPLKCYATFKGNPAANQSWIQHTCHKHIWWDNMMKSPEYHTYITDSTFEFMQIRKEVPTPNLVYPPDMSRPRVPETRSQIIVGSRDKHVCFRCIASLGDWERRSQLTALDNSSTFCSLREFDDSNDISISQCHYCDQRYLIFNSNDTPLSQCHFAIKDISFSIIFML